MSLDSSLSIASRSLANINAQMGIVANNVSNAGTPDYSAETSSQQSLTAGGQPMGVLTGAATRAVNLALQQSVFDQDTAVAGLTTTTASLQAIDAVQGTPGTGSDLGSLLGQVQSAFSTLLGDPSNAAQQSAVVTAAGTLTSGINALSNTYTQQRQAAQNDIVGAVTAMNDDLTRIGALTSQITAARTAGRSSADLENQRDVVVHALSQIVAIKTLNQSNGDLIVSTASGTQLPTRPDIGPIVTTGATVGAGATYAGGGLPAITLAGKDITSQLQGGRLGADITLRDSTLPLFQGELDEFSQSLATRFDAQGLTLFTDPAGHIPAGGGVPVQSTYVGFAAEIQVNPAVLATRSLVRDGTSGGALGFPVNPPGGPVGYTALINRVLNFALGANSQTGVPQPPIATTGLGPDGTLNAPYVSPATLADHATMLVSAQAAVSSAAGSQLSAEQAVQTTLTNTLTATSGVNMDTEMSHMIQLQNSYGASAKVITTIQAMFAALLQVMR